MILKRRKRRTAFETPVPDEWKEVLLRRVPYYEVLDDEDRRELEGHVQVFLAEKVFEGCNGQRIDDDVRLTVAGNACTLLLHRRTDYFPTVQTVLVYPRAFVTRVRRPLVDQVDVVGPEVRLGEAWAHGSVILSWEDAIFEAPEMLPFENVVLHEFAHKLDEESGPTDGVPKLAGKEAARRWQQVMSAEYQALVAADEAATPTFIDPYGAEHPSEFFAVVTEHFFMEPHGLWTYHPDLYELFVSYFDQDPAAVVERWEERIGGRRGV